MQASASPVPSQKFAQAVSPKTVRAVHSDQSAFENHRSSSLDNYEGDTMHNSLRTNPSFIKRGEHSANKHLKTDTPECSDWLQDQLRQQSAKVISEKTGQGQRAAEAVKMGRNGLNMAHLVNICRADPDFRVAFFQFCGGQLETNPNTVAALARAFEAIQRGEFSA
jgi:hypothetical protein